MSDLAQTFATFAGAARLLDPDNIRATIRATIDDGLRAANYDGVGGRSAEVSSHPERVALNPRKDSSWTDLDLIDHHVNRFVTAVAELARRSRSGRPCDDWEEAVRDAHLLAEMDAVSVLDTSGQRPGRWVHQAGDAIHDITLIRDRHCARIPTRTDLLLSGDPVCLSHARIGDYEHARHGDLVLCKTCRDLVAQVARPPEVHKDSDWWPSTDLLREHAEMERTGKRADYQRARSEWIASYPGKRAC